MFLAAQQGRGEDAFSRAALLCANSRSHRVPRSLCSKRQPVRTVKQAGYVGGRCDVGRAEVAISELAPFSKHYPHLLSKMGLKEGGGRGGKGYSNPHRGKGKLRIEDMRRFSFGPRLGAAVRTPAAAA